VIPIGLGLAWGGYTIGVWGYCLIRGYDVTFLQLFKATWPGTAGTPAKAAPGPADILPASGSNSSGSAASGSAPTPAPAPGG
jgi:hypothetical protein